VQPQSVPVTDDSQQQPGRRLLHGRTARGNRGAAQGEVREERLEGLPVRAEHGCFGFRVTEEPEEPIRPGVGAELAPGFDVHAQLPGERNDRLAAA
jgi:hypothetical protein